MDLSQVQTVPWNLNPGLQGIAVTLKKYLFFNVEKISSTWKRCSVLLVSCLYTVLLARRYENGKDTSLSGDNRRILSSTCSLLLRPGLAVWDIVAMVNTMWLSSSNPWISIMDFSPGDSCRIKQKKKKDSYNLRAWQVITVLWWWKGRGRGMEFGCEIARLSRFSLTRNPLPLFFQTSG